MKALMACGPRRGDIGTAIVSEMMGNSKIRNNVPLHWIVPMVGCALDETIFESDFWEPE